MLPLSQSLAQGRLCIGDLAVACSSESPLLENVLNECFSCLVTGPNKGTRGAVKETHVESPLAPELEFVGRHVFMNGHMALSWSHVLAERYDIDVVLAEF